MLCKLQFESLPYTNVPVQPHVPWVPYAHLAELIYISCLMHDGAGCKFHALQLISQQPHVWPAVSDER